MVHSSAGEAGSGLSNISPPLTSSAQRGSLTFRIYRDIGLAAVASELEMPATGLEPELSDAVKRGARYIDLMLKHRAAALAAISR